MISSSNISLNYWINNYFVFCSSVVGFNFDFAVLNVIGFLFYSIYNIGLYWIPLIQDQYLQRNPLGSVPVLENDLAFAFHAFLISLLTALQILCYEVVNRKPLDPGFVLLGTRQQGVSVILRELVLPD
ncbi:unnamed protein product [Schistosoma curassoni]|uniref:Uncharacterized protein n=1 Tax=Schistosoma curassoni TaxID=6186 RepID=A0A3P8CUU8_9TREM|nr:unnamed protein product [Schistosoma curassoni]